jgi:acyl carrier protein
VQCGQFATPPEFSIRATLWNQLLAVIDRWVDTVIRGIIIAFMQEELAMNESLTTKVRSVIAGHFRIDADRLTDEARFRDDLGADWLDRLELMIAIEDQVAGIEINDGVVDHIETVGDLIRIIESVDNGKSDAMLIGGMALR